MCFFIRISQPAGDLINLYIFRIRGKRKRQSMRPELGEAYKEIVAEYRNAGWGIYDDTTDMDRAVCLSDGYYGDWSSVMWLYKEIYKSSMVQNIEWVNDEYPLVPNDTTWQENENVW